MKSRMLIPTFFELSGINGECRKDSCEFLYGNLSGICDPLVTSRILQDKKMPKFDYESKFNMYMPMLEIPAKVNHPHSYVMTKDNNKRITFDVPKISGNNCMLYMQLVAMDDFDSIEGIENYKNIAYEEDVDVIKKYLKDNKSLFAKVIFHKKKVSDSNKGNFICLKENYINTNWAQNKFVFVDDKRNGHKYVLKCWVEELPIPGIDVRDYIYAYVDGSANSNVYVEDKGFLSGSGYLVADGEKTYVGHVKLYSEGRNVAGEYIAAANTINNVSKMKDKVEKLHIYYDCTQIGNTGVGIFNPEETDYVKAFKKAIENFDGDLIFEHVDAHSKIFGNEVADRLSSVINECIGREDICPKTGCFSDEMVFVEE